MSEGGRGAGAVASTARHAFADAILVADILAVDWLALGGVHVTARAGPVRDVWLSALRARLPETVPVAKIPAGVTLDRLLGGLDLAATLRTGAPVLERGLLASLDGGVALLAMAERLPTATAAHIAAVLDDGAVVLERDGFATRLGVVALDEGIEPDEVLPASLAERLALCLDLDGIAARDAHAPAPDAEGLARARAVLPRVTAPDEMIAAVTEVAFAFGISSLRAPLEALRVARVLAALDGRDTVVETDAAAAVRLVLAPRATRLPDALEPAEGDDPTEGDDPDDAPPPSSPETGGTGGDGGSAADADRLVEAVAAALPPGMLDRLAMKIGRKAPAVSGGKGTATVTPLRGRPTGVRAGRPGNGARLSVVDTLKAAAPWQPLRRRAGEGRGRRFEVRPDDFRIRRFKDRRETVTIFVVDASGSTANARLAEAKGAVELMLGESYARRASVALVAFRGTGAELILPPTRSLTRAKRLLQTLPGGGGTPLAAALDAARSVCESVVRKGYTPSVVILSDGRANVSRDGTGGRATARDDAVDGARRLAAIGAGTLVIDTGRRTGADARALAEAAGATYLWLPTVEARAILHAANNALRA